jgi:hypothetical protein
VGDDGEVPVRKGQGTRRNHQRSPGASSRPGFLRACLIHPGSGLYFSGLTRNHQKSKMCATIISAAAPPQSMWSRSLERHSSHNQVRVTTRILGGRLWAKKGGHQSMMKADRHPAGGFGGITVPRSLATDISNGNDTGCLTQVHGLSTCGERRHSDAATSSLLGIIL